MTRASSATSSAKSTCNDKTSISISRKRKIQGGDNKDDDVVDDNEDNDTLSDAEIRQLLREAHHKATDCSIKREQQYDLASCSVIDSFIFHFVHSWNTKSHRSQTQYLRLKQSKDPSGHLEQVALEEWELIRPFLELNAKYHKISATMGKERHLIKCHSNPGVNMKVTQSKRTGKITMKPL